ncbi:MAG: hypothetical protein C0594_11415 [Marinilabiliales bacterium]|nr:MAG: hypothetical protein C0594_11415 [Marinilabiliales bacterium]
MFSSCGLYESQVPINKVSKQKIDSALVGNWTIQYYNNEWRNTDNDYISIIPFNQHEYLVRLIGIKDSIITDIMLFRMYPSRIKDHTIYNMQIMETGTKSSFSFYTVNKINEKQLLLKGLSENFTEIEFNKSKDLSKYIMKNYSNFEENCVELGTLDKTDNFNLANPIK